MTQFIPSTLSNAAALHGGPYPANRLARWSLLYASASLGEIEFVAADAAKSNYKFYRLSMEGKYSVNVIGYITVTVPPGFAMITNPLTGEENKVSELLRGMPDGTTFSKFD